ncbi:MAG TPA: AAA family ATPase, partial [Acinetobacter sp.]|nr:AAA family ATPase [Acinetobacter sp.]
DAANLLKPALARGELRTIAATTWAEYKQYFEKDAALSRRFQVVKVEEPTEEVAIDMLRAMIPVMQSHFNLHIDDQAIVTAVHSSHRYISGRQLPDKAISVLDTAAARVALTQNAQPVILDQLKAQQHNLKLEHQILTHEHQQFPIHHQRLDDLHQRLSSLETEIQDTESKWQQELGFVKQIQQLSAQDDNEDTKQQLASLRGELSQLQGQTPLVFERVNAHIINEIISDWTGIPIGKMVNDEIKQILSLEDKLGQRVMGQDYALSQLVQGIKTSKAKLEDPNKPQGVFLLIGPSGVGKTETALALANELYGGEQHLITINMSEYQEAHTVSSLKGAPPGYVGYGQGGVLTEAVRRNPYSVVLLDEIEKAHSDVQELFYQVLDKGMLEDGEGRIIDFKNTIILLTSNTGSNAIMQACLNQPVEQWPNAED